ncbi:MAG: hypothetical protein QOE45_1101 [Frankiaceae bacterium]|jgi:hypothetical protein|nr:hypothetical protein [Frankiaceae bacterium]
MRFRYREEGSPPVPRPTVDVRLQYGVNGDWMTRALIDSGSPLTVFDYGTAEALGVRIGQAGHRSGTIALMGSARPVQFEQVQLSIPKMTDVSWGSDVAFIKQTDFQMPFQGILGQQGFLDRFAVTFRYFNGHFDIEGS